MQGRNDLGPLGAVLLGPKLQNALVVGLVPLVERDDVVERELGPVLPPGNVGPHAVPFDEGRQERHDLRIEQVVALPVLRLHQEILVDENSLDGAERATAKDGSDVALVYAADLAQHVADHISSKHACPQHCLAINRFHVLSKKLVVG